MLCTVSRSSLKRMSRLLVSILIPVYNRAEIISETIESALSQTYSDYEIVIVDNNSKDGTWNIIKDYAQSYSRIRAFKNDSNIGPVKNWKRCLDEAWGEYGKILWSDDLIEPDFLEKTTPLLRREDTGFVYTPAVIFGDGVREYTCYDLNQTGLYPTEMFIRGSLLGSGSFPVSPGCALFRIRDLRNNLLVDISNKIQSDFSQHAIGNDLLIFLLTAAHYKYFAFIKETKAYFRAHPNSISVSAANGKLPLHYALAKAFFIEEQNKYNSKVIKKFNTYLAFLLLKYRKNPYGFRAVSDFYMHNTNYSIDYFFAVKKATNKILRKFLAKSTFF